MPKAKMPRPIRGQRYGIPDGFPCSLRGDTLVVYDAENDLNLTFDTARHPASEIAVAFGLYLFGAYGQHSTDHMAPHRPPG